MRPYIIALRLFDGMKSGDCLSHRFLFGLLGEAHKAPPFRQPLNAEV
jgi:hypothetical protein